MTPRFSIKDLLDIAKMKAFDKELRSMSTKTTKKRLKKQITYKKLTANFKLIEQMRKIGKSVRDLLP